MYGLVNAPRLWYRVIAGFLLATSWKRHSQDPAVFMLYQDSVLVAVIALHVDDVLLGVKDLKIVQPLRDRFTWGAGSFENINDVVFCGRRIVHEPGKRMIITQEAFCGAIEINRISKERRQQATAPLSTSELSELSSCIGSLNWVGNNSRPALQATTSLLQGGDKTVEMLNQAQLLLREVRDRPSEGLQLLYIDLDAAITLVHADGSFANAANHKTQSGYLIYAAEVSTLTADGGTANLIDWRSHRLRRAAHCTLYV